MRSIGAQAIHESFSPRDSYDEPKSSYSPNLTKFVNGTRLPPAGSRSLLAKGVTDSDLHFTPGVYQNLSRKKTIPTDNLSHDKIRYSQALPVPIPDGRNLHAAGTINNARQRRKKIFSEMDSPDYEDRFGQRTKMERNKSDFGMKPPSRIPDGLRNYMNSSLST